MNRPIRWLAASAVALASAAPAARAQQTQQVPADSLAARVTALADDFMAKGLQRYPEQATYYGLPGMRHDRLTDNSPAAARQWERQEDAWYEQVRAIDASRLVGRPEWITYGFLREQLESSRATRVCRAELWNISQMTGWQVGYPFLAQAQPVGSDSARAQTLARWRALPRYIDTETANWRQGVREGYTAPKLIVRRIIEQLDLLAQGPATQSPFYAPAQRDSNPAFARALAQIIEREINPAIRRQAAYLRSEYLPAARESIAISSNPHGEECYRAAARSFSTVEMDPRQIHQTGLEQMARIDAEMRQIAQRSFQTTDVPALLERFKTDPQFLFKTRQDVVAYANQAVERSKHEMGRWFGRLPKADVVVEPYAEFEERSAPGGSYNSPADDGSRPGIYKINTYKPEETTRVGQESTAFHEVIPGHHLQLAIAQERQGAHPITRFLGNSGFSEGWGLYAERLADEMGLFGSDLDRMGMLSNEALRAARMVVDPGMHVLGWSRQQAIDYMLAHTAESRQSVENEIDRYIIWPGQATAYMTGNLEIRRLREMAQRELGPRFDIRAFHDRVLENGTVTLPMLRENIERWVAQEKSDQTSCTAACTAPAGTMSH
jgi:uncharacterized protein (DUF885 family)